MKKIFIVLGLVFVSAYSHAATLAPQFHVWKTSWLPSANYSMMLTSAPIIFHMATGSSTLNAGTGYFSVLQTTNEFNIADPAISTRAFYNLDSIPGGVTNLGTVFDVTVTSHTFLLKSGGNAVLYLWDWLSPPSYKTPYDGK